MRKEKKIEDNVLKKWRLKLEFEESAERGDLCVYRTKKNKSVRKIVIGEAHDVVGTHP